MYTHLLKNVIMQEYPYDEAKNFIKARFNTNNMLDIVESVYRENADKFTLKALIHNLKIQNNHDCESYVGLKDFGKFPCVPIEAFQELPEGLLTDMLGHYNLQTPSEQDAFLLGASSALGRLFDWIHGVSYN